MLFGHDHNTLVDWLVKSWLTEGPQVAAIIGASGVGKTTVMRAFTDQVADRSHVLVVDVPEVTGDPFEPLVQEIGKVLSQNNLIEAPPAERLFNSRVVSARIAELLNDPKTQYVLVLDEFQRTLMSEGGETAPGIAELLAPVVRPPRHAGRLLLVSNRKIHGEWTEAIERRELTGLGEAGRAMFDAELAKLSREREVPESRRDDLVRWVVGNPRALKLIAASLEWSALNDLIGERPALWEARERNIAPELLQKIEEGLFRKALAGQPEPVRRFLLNVSVFRRPFPSDAVVPFLASSERGKLAERLRHLTERYLLTYRDGSYSLSEVGRDVCREKLRRASAKEFKNAHRLAGDYYKRQLEDASEEDSNRFRSQFAETRFHFHQAARKKELEKLTREYSGFLRSTIEANSPVPDKPALLDERITTVRALLAEAEADDPLLEFHLAKCLEQRNQPDDWKVALEILQRREIAFEWYWPLRIRLEDAIHGPEKAHEVGLRGLSILPITQRVSAYQALNAILLNAKRIDDCLRLVQNARELDPRQRHHLYVGIARTMARSGLTAEAARTWIESGDQELEKHPEIVERVRTLLGTNQPDLAFEVLIGACEDGVGELGTTQNAFDLIWGGNIDDALLIYHDRKAKSLNPENRITLVLQFASKLTQAGEHEHALDLLSDSLEDFEQSDSRIVDYLLAIGSTGAIDACQEIRLSFLGRNPKYQAKSRIDEAVICLAAAAARRDLLDQLAQPSLGSTEVHKDVRFLPTLFLHMLNDEWAATLPGFAEKDEYYWNPSYVLYWAFCQLACGDRDSASRVLSRADRKIVISPNTTGSWLKAFVALECGDPDSARKNLARHMGVGDRQLKLATRAEILRRWDSIEGRSLQHPAFQFPILPARLVGTPTSVRRPPTFEPVLQMILESQPAASGERPTHVIRQTQAKRWELRYPGDEADDFFDDAKGFLDINELIRRSPHEVKALSLIGDSNDPVKAVKQRMKNAVDRIEAVMPKLAAHFQASMQWSGESCRYDPPGIKPSWQLD